MSGVRGRARLTQELSEVPHKRGESSSHQAVRMMATAKGVTLLPTSRRERGRMPQVNRGGGRSPDVDPRCAHVPSYILRARCGCVGPRNEPGLFDPEIRPFIFM